MGERPPSWPDQPLSRSAWLLGMAGVAAVVVAILIVLPLSPIDRGQQQQLVRTFGAGHLRGAMGHSDQTSGPGMGVTTPVYVVAHLFLGVRLSYVAASLSCLVALAVAAVAALRAAGVARRSLREVLGLLGIVTGSPVLACYLEAFHPSDVLATAAVLAAYAAVIRHRIGWAAALLGFGLATRQWVLVAIAVLAVLERGDASKLLVAGSLATFVLVVLPVAIVDPSPTLYDLGAHDTIATDLGLTGLVHLPTFPLYLLSRVLPLVLGAALCGWLHLRRARATPEVAITALLVALSVRAVLDPAGFGYYAAPGYATLIVVLVSVVRRWWWPALAAAGGVVLAARMAVYGKPVIVQRLQAGKALPSRPVEVRSVPWATSYTLLLLVLPVVGMVLLERVSRAPHDPAAVELQPVDARDRADTAG